MDNAASKGIFLGYRRMFGKHTDKHKNKQHHTLRGVISKIRAKWGMFIMGDTADPNSALCIHMIH